ncbi:hypothetical protein HanPI659440_Chr00c01g0705571 [Helianthus annuus]|nr:hypothetical protein HanPI659440_Chr00c01g0705571 [Helianthus annuus]
MNNWRVWDKVIRGFITSRQIYVKQGTLRPLPLTCKVCDKASY